MTWYNFMLFLHIVGAISLFTVTGIVFACLLRLRRAETVEQAREWISLPNALGNSVPLFELVMLLTGLWLISQGWWQARPAWALVSLGTIVVLIPFGLVTIGRPLLSISRRLKDLPDGPLPTSLREQTCSLLLLTMHCLFLTLLLGIVFLMAVKPEITGSLVTQGVALGLGGAFSFVLRSVGNTQTERQVR